ncbi:hypothetical protein RRG08_059899 [Elysia crispata]|uniref:Uncharacterized protein n=1 Tax=Elysia crispata TaxID=231223 RepID=A0AAE0Y7I5_9GAST|nr:hypothetical protein RRG08_059899 [Elysia crispata]
MKRIRISVEHLLMVTTGSSLILGIVIVVVGASIRVDAVRFINAYGASLDDALDRNVCVDPRSGIDFCNRRDDLSQVYLGEWVVALGSVLVTTGFFVNILSVLGITAAFQRFKALLSLMIAVICIALGFEAFVIDILTNEESMFHIQAKQELVSLFKDNYELAMPENNSFTQAMNLVMLQASRSPKSVAISQHMYVDLIILEDFGGNISFVSDDGFVYSFLYPPACCRRELLNERKFNIFTRLHDCIESPPSVWMTSDINTEGCYTTMIKYVSDVYGTLANGILLYLVISHCVAAVLAVMILMRPPIPARFFKVEESEGFTLTMGSFEQPQHRFLPYAKSDDLSECENDPSKNGSTEIW